MAGLAPGIASCGSGNGQKLGERVVPLGQPVPKGGGVYQTGKPYEVSGVTYTPREDTRYDRVGRASWYGEMFHGRRTANGEIYDMERLSAAHPTLPLPTYARVTNLSNGRSIVVRVNDRGPYANDRVLDVSRRSAELLGFRQNGVAQVRVQYLGRAPLNGDDSYERRYLASQPWTQVATRNKPKTESQDPIAVGSIPDGGRGGQAAEGPPEAGAKIKSLAEEEAEHEEAAKPQWQASARAAKAPGKPKARLVAPAATVPSSSGGRFMIQAGSFKSKENADRARTKLSGIASVDVAPVPVGEETFFRVRVGPFNDANEANAALGQVTEAGYSGAKLVAN